MPLPPRITMDGTAGCGKSTTGKLLAEKLGYTFFDTGKLYRAIARQVVVNGVAAEDQEAVLGLAGRLDIWVNTSAETGAIQVQVQSEYLDQQELETEEINRTVPVIAAYPRLREIVRVIQRRIAREGKVIMAGRDIGSVVLPDAEFKVFLEVSLEERVRRRYQDQKHLPGVTPESVRASLIRRDELDTQRHESPLVVPEGAVVIVTDGIDPAEAVKRIIQKMGDV